jgi:cytochrome c biogenesis protein ResB
VVVSVNARWLRSAIALLVLAIAATTIGTLLDQIGG